MELDGWRLFMDGGFRPSARNMNLVARVLGWNKEIPRYYVSLVGFEESGCFEYQKGSDLPVLGPCAVGSPIVRLPREEMILAVRSEVNKALARLVKLLHENHGVTETVVEIPDYSTVAGGRCLCCGQRVTGGPEEPQIPTDIKNMIDDVLSKRIKSA